MLTTPLNNPTPSLKSHSPVVSRPLVPVTSSFFNAHPPLDAPPLAARIITRSEELLCEMGDKAFPVKARHTQSDTSLKSQETFHLTSILAKQQE